MVTHTTSAFLCIQFHPLLTALRDRLNDKYNLNLDSILANLYRDGHDSVDWHSDNEPALGRCPTIASLSFGDTRNFELRQVLEVPQICFPITIARSREKAFRLLFFE